MQRSVDGAGGCTVEANQVYVRDDWSVELVEGGTQRWHAKKCGTTLKAYSTWERAVDYVDRKTS